MTEEEPLRYPLQMTAEFAQQYTRDQVIGTPIRFSMLDDVVATGIVIDWTGNPDGTVTLTVEKRIFG